jgi:natural product precursor
MREVQKLKLVQLSQSELDKKEMNKLRGGGCCICGCKTSPTMDNAASNNLGDKIPADGGGGYGNGSFG